MKTNHFNHIHYEQLIDVLKEESKEKDIIIKLLKDRIYNLTVNRSDISHFATSNEQLIRSINCN